MKRESFLILLGVLIALAPFSGIPLSWLTWVILVLGLFVVLIGIIFRRDRNEREQGLAGTHAETGIHS